MNHTTTDAAALPAFIANPPKRKRRAFKRATINGEPTIRPLPGGAVSVSLFGSRAAGRCMVLDADVWAAVARTHTR